MAANRGPAPLHERIELAEAVVELYWANIKDLPAPRGFDSMRTYQAAKDSQMAKIDRVLEAMLGMYDQRRLEQSLEAS